MTATPLTASQIELVKATVPVLKEHGEAITTVFYDNLLAAHPSLRNIFSSSGQASGRQPRALAGAVLAYAAHVDNPAALLSAVERIAHKHVSLGVEPAQYPIVGQFLLGAIAQVLGPAVATPAILDAWAAAYAVLADIFVAAEAGLRAANRAATAGAWDGSFRRFRVVRREDESSLVTSLYLALAEDGDRCALPPFRPGQYVTLRVRPSADGPLQCRQYSLSEAHHVGGGAYYRVSVRRHHPAGAVSAALHGAAGAVGAEVEVSLPQGEFCLGSASGGAEADADAPVVLISAGVGATPVMAMLGSLVGTDAAAAEGTRQRRPVSWIHASRSSAEMPFADAVRRVCRDNENVSAHVFLKSVGAGDRAGLDYEFGQTRLDLTRLHKDQDLFVADARTEYFICGPESFMLDVKKALVDLGVDAKRTHMELFAAGGVAEE